MYTHTYIDVHTNMLTYIRTHTYICTYIIYTHTCTYIHTCICIGYSTGWRQLWAYNTREIIGRRRIPRQLSQGCYMP